MAVLSALAADAAEHRLSVLGAFHTRREDGLPPGATLVLLGPGEGFWAHFTGAPEYLDGGPDPMDRWSARVIGQFAEAHSGEAFFPFGTPARPFIGWALRSGRAWVSPVGLLVHDTAGLLVSYRGAVLLGSELPLPETPRCPCETCLGKPCLSACPAHALRGKGYDLAACHAYLDTRDGEGCMTRGCEVRRACPAGANYTRDPSQSAFHMAAFHPAG